MPEGVQRATDARALPGRVASIASRDAGPAFLAGGCRRAHRLTIHSRLITSRRRALLSSPPCRPLAFLRLCSLDCLTRHRSSHAARRRRGPLPCPHPPGRPREVTSSHPGRRTEPAARTIGASAAIPRGTWWPARRNLGLLGADAEVGGDDRVELRAHPCWLGADQVGEAALLGLGQPRALDSRGAGNARAVHLDHSQGHRHQDPDRQFLIAPTVDCVKRSLRITWRSWATPWPSGNEEECLACGCEQSRQP